MARVFFLTYSDRPKINNERMVRDDLLAEELRRHNVDVMPKVWDEDIIAHEDVMAKSYKEEPESTTIHVQSDDVYIIRSMWDYHLKILKFLKWLDDMEVKNAQVLNPIPVIRWSMHKKYLLELADKGVSIAETKLVKKGTKGAKLTDFVKSWAKIITKPCIASSAFLLKRLQTLQEAKEYQDKFEDLLEDRDFLVQKYIEGISVHGEWSLMFFNRQFSHAVVKFPPHEDFRVYYELGGEVKAVNPPKKMLALAAIVLNMVPGELVYARVDILRDVDERMYIGELELIEPQLFLDFDEQAPKRFASAILEQVKTLGANNGI